MTQRPNHEARTDLYGKVTGRHFWADHEAMPDRPQGLHAYTVHPTPEAALDSLHAEAGARLERGEMKDGRHKFTVYEHVGRAEPDKVVQGFHEVKDGKTVEGTGNGFAPDLGGAKNYIKGWFDATNGRQ